MPRIRTIKAEFWTDSTMVLLPYQVRLFYIGLWNFADDYGWLVDEPFRLKMQIFPGDAAFDVDASIDLLVAAERLHRFEDEDGTPYLQVVHWEHQRVDHPGKPVLEGIDQISPVPMSEEDRVAIAERWDCAAILKIRRASSRKIANARAGRGGEKEEEREEERKEAPAAQLTAEQQEMANKFHSILMNTPGYEGSREFLAHVVIKYAELDLEEEAMKIASHAKTHKGWYTDARALNWLGGDLDGGAQPRGKGSRNGAAHSEPPLQQPEPDLSGVTAEQSKAAKEAWNTALAQLQNLVNVGNFETFLRDTKGLAFDGTTFTVGAPNPFIREALQTRFHGLLRKALGNVLGGSPDVVVLVKRPQAATVKH